MEEENFPKILAVAAIILNTDGNILLRKRTKEPDMGKWQLAASYVDPGETMVDAVKRIIAKKVNINETQSIEFTGLYRDDPGRHPSTYCVPLIFKVIVSNDTLKDLPKDGDIRWFTPDEASQLEMALDNQDTLKLLEII